MNKFKVGDKVVLSELFITTYHEYIKNYLDDNPKNFLGLIVKVRKSSYETITKYDLLVYDQSKSSEFFPLDGTPKMCWLEEWFELEDRSLITEEDML